MKIQFAGCVLFVIAILFFLAMIAAASTNNSKIFDDSALILAPMAAFVIGVISRN